MPAPFQAYSLKALARKRASGAAPSSGGFPKGLASCVRRQVAAAAGN